MRSSGTADRRNSRQREHRPTGSGVIVLLATNAVFAGITSVGVPLSLGQQGLTKLAIACFFVVTATFAVGYNLVLVPRLSRGGRSTGLLAGTTFAVPVGLMLVRSFGTVPPLLLLGGALMVFSSTLLPQVLGRSSERHQDASTLREISLVRQILVAGYIVGLGLYALSSAIEMDPLVLGALVALCGCAGFAFRDLRDAPRVDRLSSPRTPTPSTGSGTARSDNRRTSLLVLWGSLALVALMKSVDVLRSVYLPLFAATTGASTTIIASLFMTAAAFELALLPVLARLQQRRGTAATLVVVSVVGSLSFLVLVLAQSGPVLLASQAMYACFGAGFQSIGIMLLAQTTGRGVGQGAGVFMSVMQIGTVLGALLPIAVPGYSANIFLIALMTCAACCAIALLLGGPLSRQRTWPHNTSQIGVPMRILVISPYWHWRDNTGAPQRVGVLVQGLARVGEVDFLAYSDLGDPNDGSETDHTVSQLRTAMYPNATSRRRRFLTALIGPEQARILLARRVCTPLAREMHERRDYSLVVCVREMSWFVAGASLPCPAVVDVDDFAEVVLQRWLDLGLNDIGEPARGREVRSMRRRIRVLDRQHQRVARSGATRLVVSAADATRAPSAEVVPNAFPATTRAAPIPLVARGNVLTFIGMHHYPPNADAARWFATEVLPLVAEQVPDVEFRIVGRAGGQVVELGDLPNVVVTGHVADVSDELARAKVVAVPLRVGAGSRIKILEAMASSVPVVSTSIGAEGIDLEPGVHAFIADGTERLAAACIRALRADDDVRAVVDAGTEFVQRHAPELIEARMAEIAWHASRAAP